MTTRHKEYKTENNESFWVSLGKDLLSVAAVLLAFTLLSHLIFGMWTPMVAVESGSMEPHMYRGDIIFIKNIDRVNLVTSEEAMNGNSSHMSFGGGGDVILYYPYGQKGVTPIIHRAMYHVSAGEPMWQNGPLAPYDGYITKGDNPETNKYYDQMSSISYNMPVKDEWIIGVAKYRIPYAGYLRLLFS